MSHRLDSKSQIWTLAHDLGLRPELSPCREILKHIRQRVRGIAKKYSCTCLTDLLTAAAAEMDTIFEEIHSDEDLAQIRAKYLRLGETGFANLHAELQGTYDYGVTFRRLHREAWENLFVSVIDCRGEKIFRRYFTKWHELAHLLTLTPQMRLVFRRSHSPSAPRDPEEMLMDVIAGEAGFIQDFLPSHLPDGVSFRGIRRIHDECCQDASVQSATIGIVKALPVPCILLEAGLALRKRDETAALQMGLSFGESTPSRALRALHVTINSSASDLGIRMYKKWRVPAESVIARVFAQGGDSHAEEDLSWWQTSDGSRLDPCPVHVEARKTWNSVQALLVPRCNAY